ncbi:MAG: imidazole glycerol phosphate synthase subunit HisH [Gammaproteobacteria bacterium]|nr:MAG: imidazole glycerol phosphate synthase subunit HisH [Gammaproteobacteria bacterium]
MKNILIIDTKAGNLFSLRAAIERLDFNVTILEQPSNECFDAVVIPGQGRFGTVINNISKYQWPEYLKKSYENNVPILGICVGMQIFFEASEEDPDVKGLCWFKGHAKALDFPKKPMVGWAKLTSQIKVYKNAVVYFVNSYAIKQNKNMIAESSYGETFCAAVKKGSFTGVQFHPEKSSDLGSVILLEALTMSQQNDQ